MGIPGLLLYSYSHGVFSSRKVEQATDTDVAVCFITADHHPDHDTICAFRRHNHELIKDTFGQSLRLAGAVGILQLGSIKAAMDGTKIAGNLSSQQTLTQAQITEQIEKHQAQEKELQGTIGQLLGQTDRDEQTQSPALPDELADPKQRAEKLARKRHRRERLSPDRDAKGTGS